jgi:hypothetical protein
MIYKTSEYRDRFHPTRSVDYVLRLIKKGNMPSKHVARKVGVKVYVIEVPD